jgi:methionyl-tRNA formyltransferase
LNYIFFGNNRVALEALRWLVRRGQPPVALVVHAPEKAKYRDDLIAVAGLPGERVFDGSQLDQSQTLERIQHLGPQLGLSISFGYILKAPLLNLLPQGCLNLHSSYLPYNRGAHPNIWSIVDRSPAGVSLHYMDAGIDTGDIIAQREVSIAPTDTGETLYRKLEDACLVLLQETWPGVVSGTVARQLQPKEGTFHRTSDVQRIDHIELDREYTARYLIDVLRARTFATYKSAYFVENGRKVYVRVTLEEEPPS